MKIENHSTRMTEEQFDELKKKLEEKPNEVLDKLQLRLGETDIRKLSEADFKQSVYRYMNDSLNAYNLMIQTLLDINLILLESMGESKKNKVLAKLDSIKTGGK